MSKAIKEVVAVFDDEKSLDDAVAALKSQGFTAEAFSVLASEEAVERKLGRRYQCVRDVEDLPNVPRDSFVSRIARLRNDYLAVPAFASIGALAFAFFNPIATVVVATAAGGALGAALGSVAHGEFVERLAEQLQRGGLVLWVRVRDAKEELAARKTLIGHAAHDVHTHEIDATAIATSAPE